MMTSISPNAFKSCLIATVLFCAAMYQVGMAQTNQAPTNVILLIGDGMGLTQMSSIYFRNAERVHFDRFTNIGLIKTWASNSKITDSAAGATAFSAGIKTYNGALGVDPDTNNVETIVEHISPMGITTALIATSSITHATPAAFYAHVASRNMHPTIAEQLTASDVDFFAGGGRQFFSSRDDGQDYLAKLKDQGFEVSTNKLLSTESINSDNKYGFLLADDGMPKVIEGRGNFLPDAATLALDYVTKKGAPFFMMIEGSQIDWGGHQNSAEYLMTEVEDFNLTLGRVLDFAEQEGNTLVVVTADHETGGFALSASEGNYDMLAGTFSTGGHTATLVPVYAIGPGAERFNGIYQNTAIHTRILEATGW